MNCCWVHYFSELQEKIWIVPSCLNEKGKFRLFVLLFFFLFDSIFRASQWNLRNMPIHVAKSCVTVTENFF